MHSYEANDIQLKYKPYTIKNTAKTYTKSISYNKKQAINKA